MYKNENYPAVGYVRVSGQGQVNGTGFARQKEAVRAFCRERGMDLVRYYEETHTGTEEARPVFAQMMLDLLSNGCKTIVVESLDRLARDLTVQMQLLAKIAVEGITLYSATTGQDVTAAMKSDPMLKAMVQVQGTFAELDKSLLVRKLRVARESVRKKNGRCEGRKPYGTFPGELEILDRIRKLNRKPRNGERLGPYEIANMLNEEGYLTRTGKPWHGTTVKRILGR